MVAQKKGYFDYDAVDWVMNQYSDKEWDSMAGGEHARLINMEEQEREFIAEVLERFSDQ